MKKSIIAFISAVGTLFLSTPLSAQDNPISVGFNQNSNTDFIQAILFRNSSF
ncbi:hypothetical protein ACFX5U_12835 [Sphingobacterium sp. SG20118]|uniref:hypothetical protein n=1 Tax=Sphingobacterium sp. SG20118 TaxID=3367156 RepID=UPI0037DFC937